MATHSQERFTTLDVMRGVAALFVVLVHYGYNIGGYTPQLSLLAVDAFFVLSGFVIAYKYEDKLQSGGMTMRYFMGKRLERLAPLYLAGFVLGAVVQYVFHADGLYSSKLVAGAALNLVGLPAVGMVSRSASLFPINHPFWSLFFELWVANLLYALGSKWIRGFTLGTLLTISAAGLIYFGIRLQGLSGGYSLNTLGLGFCRVIFSFYAGVAALRLYRARRPSFSVPPLLIMAVLSSVFILPLSEKHSALIQAAAIILVFPALTFFGATARTMPRRAGELLGDGSYAVYALHYPLLVAAQHLLSRPIHAHLLTSQLAFAAVMLVLGVPAAKVDERVRKWLKANAHKLHSGDLLVTRLRTVRT